MCTYFILWIYNINIFNYLFKYSADTDASFATKIAASQEGENFSKLLTEWQNYAQVIIFFL